MAIEKALNQAPLGMTGMMAMEDMEPAIEIEIEDPEEVSIEMDGLEIILEPGDEDDEGFSDNLAETMAEDALIQLAGDLIVRLKRIRVASGLDADVRRRPRTAWPEN
jgi:hypothetical protein